MTASKKQKPLKLREAKKATLQLAHAYNKGLLLFQCHSCNVLVHQHCCDNLSDFPEPKIDEKYEETFKSVEWLCDYCANEVKGECKVCEKQYPRQLMHSPDMHLYCAFWFNEVEVSEEGRTTGLNSLQRYKLDLCSICGETRGAKVKCSMSTCSLKMHPICAKDGLTTYTQILVGMKAMFCEQHSRSFIATAVKPTLN